MSISTQLPKHIEEITRDRVLKKNSIRRIVKKTISVIGDDPLNFLLIFCYLITGINTLLGVQLNWEWYILLLILTALFTIDKFNLIKSNK